MNVEKLLRDEIVSEFDELSKMQIGSEEYKAAVDGITKLVDRAIVIDKNDSDLQDRIDAREIEHQFKREQIRHEKIDSVVKNVLTCVSIVGGIALTIWGTKKSLDIEFNGNEIITSTAGKEFFKKLFKGR